MRYNDEDLGMLRVAYLASIMARRAQEQDIDDDERQSLYELVDDIRDIFSHRDRLAYKSRH